VTRADRDLAEPDGSSSRPQVAVLFRHPRLGPVLAAEGLSATGDAVFWVGLLVWLLGRPHGTGLVALAALVRLGPRVVLGAAGGVFADRHDRRRLLVALDAARAVLMVVLAWITSSGGGTAGVLVIVLVTYVLATPYRPAMTAGIPFVVGEGDASAANALDGVIRQVATFLGPLLGSALLWAGSPAWAFACNAATFALSALLLAGVPSLGGTPPALRLRHFGHPVGTWWAALVDGVRAVTAQTGLVLMTWLVFVFSMARGFELVLLVFVAQDRLGLGSEGVGVLSAAIGVGALLALPSLGRIAAVQRPVTAVVLALFATAVPFAMLGVVESTTVACCLLAVLGVGVVVFEVLSITVIQRLSRVDLLGRVFGIQNMAINAGKLAGSLLGPLLVATMSVESALAAAALIVTVSAIVALPRLHRIGRAAASRRDALEPVVSTLAALPLFSGASRPTLERVAASARLEAAEAGRRIVTEGEPADRLYVIRVGTFDVQRRGAHVASLGPRDWFGEIGLLRHTPRTATVVASSAGELWSIPGAEFLAAVAGAASPPTSLLDSVAARMAELDTLDGPVPPA
jgi:predicted MFS family arabinose efflux permease